MRCRQLSVVNCRSSVVDVTVNELTVLGSGLMTLLRSTIYDDDPRRSVPGVTPHYTCPRAARAAVAAIVAIGRTLRLTGNYRHGYTFAITYIVKVESLRPEHQVSSIKSRASSLVRATTDQRRTHLAPLS